MHFASTLHLPAVLAIVAAVTPACVAVDEDVVDGRDDAFASGKGDGIEIGTWQAQAALRVANTVDADVLARRAADGGVGLGRTAARGVVAARELATLAELDAVPYIGPIALQRMVDYALAHDLAPSSGLSCAPSGPTTPATDFRIDGIWEADDPEDPRPGALSVWVQHDGWREWNPCSPSVAQDTPGVVRYHCYHLHGAFHDADGPAFAIKFRDGFRERVAAYDVDVVDLTRDDSAPEGYRETARTTTSFSCTPTFGQTIEHDDNTWDPPR